MFSNFTKVITMNFCNAHENTFEHCGKIKTRNAPNGLDKKLYVCAKIGQKKRDFALCTINTVEPAITSSQCKGTDKDNTTSR